MKIRAGYDIAFGVNHDLFRRKMRDAERDPDLETAAAPGLAFDLHAAAVKTRDFHYQREADARALEGTTLTGTRLADMTGWGWRAAIHPDHADQVLAKIKMSFISGGPWEDTFPVRSKDGDYRWLSTDAASDSA